MGYSAGNLELSILGFSDKAVASVDVTTKALRRLASAVELIGKTNFTQAGLQLNYIFKEIANSTNQINTKNIENLASAAKSLSSISKLSNLEKMDFEKVGSGFNTLSVAIKPFLDEVKSAENSLVALERVLAKSSGKKIQGLLGGNSGKGRSGGGLFAFAKIGTTIYMARRLGRVISNIVQAGSDYTETLNLWQVAMRDNLDLADQFVNKLNKAYGISTKAAMEAQATFKNMIGSLGQISDDVAYQLSEALVVMSADYASLYNRTLESAISNMQSMLAGQVRPIRSAGLDITETTLFQFYQSIGGTKTMRQLNRTEKQLLSILAVYRQMGKAGATGDMAKTINQFANQSRAMTEYWAELKTWSGLLLKDLIEQSGMLVYINALLITATEIVKAIAKSRGIGDENYLTGLFETTEATNDAVDELQGKLLDFDKFRSLQGQEQSPLAIDDKVLEALTGYTSVIDQAENEAAKLAETWTKWWISKDGGLTEQAKTLLNVLKAIGVVLLSFAAVSLFSGIAKMFKMLTLLNGTTVVLVAGFALLAYGIISFVSAMDEMSGVQKWITVILALVAAVVAFKIALSSLGSVTLAIAAGAAVTGAILAASSAIKFDVPNYENGASDIDSGTIFRAGEFGKTEAVYTGSNGKTNVANVKQMEQAFYNALSRYGSEGDNKIVVETYLDGEKVYQNTTAHAKQRGKVWANV